MGIILNGHNVYVLMLIGMNKYTYIYACTYVMMKLLNEREEVRCNELLISALNVRDNHL